jgi:hypothetical protein
VTDTLGVALNRDGLHSIAVQERFETTGSFVVELQNHGAATHVHLNLDDSLSAIGEIGATNHYVEAENVRKVSIDTVDHEAWPQDTVRGKLKVVVAHGQQTHWVDVELDRTPITEPVEVDPELNRPDPEDTDDGSPLLRGLPVGVLGGIALILAIGALFVDGLGTVLGGLSLAAGVACAAAAYLLLS